MKNLLMSVFTVSLGVSFIGCEKQKATLEGNNDDKSSDKKTVLEKVCKALPCNIPKETDVKDIFTLLASFNAKSFAEGYCFRDARKVVGAKTDNNGDWSCKLTGTTPTNPVPNAEYCQSMQKTKCSNTPKDQTVATKVDAGQNGFEALTFTFQPSNILKSQFISPGYTCNIICM